MQFLGYVTAPVTGDYTFYLNSDSSSIVPQAPNLSPASKRLIATEPQWNSPRSWVSGGNAASRHPAPADSFFADALFIEAEDFDFGGGRFVADVATGMNGSYAGGAYTGRGTAADAGIDWHDGDAANQGSVYRGG